MKKCILCGKPTAGSVGAAGLRWSFICQSCKDTEDKALEQRIGLQAKMLDTVCNALVASHKEKI